MARDFDGNGDVINYTVGASVSALTTYSIAAWVYPDSVSSYKQYIHFGGSYPNQTMDVEFDAGWRFYHRWSGNADTNWSISAPSTGAWVHTCITYNGTSTANDPNWYINGALQSESENAAPSGTAVALGTQMGVGSSPTELDVATTWDGRIAEVAIWNRILSASEAALLADGFSPMFIRNGLVFYDPLIRSTSDIKGGIVGVPTNTTVIAHPKIIRPSSMFTGKFSAPIAPIASLGNYIDAGWII